MAVLNKIRQRSFFLIVIIALALFSFILADLFRNSGGMSASSQNIIATINGKEITRENFVKKVEAVQRQLGPNATATMAMNRVFDQEVRQLILEDQFETLGLTVEKDQIRNLLKTNLQNSPEFQNEAGLFDEAKLDAYIANLKATSEANYQQWLDYERSLAVNANQENYFNLVKSAMNGTLSEGELEYHMQSDKVAIKYVQIPYSSIPDSTITVSDKDIENYIDNHKKQFKVEASRDINYILFKEEASKKDESALKDALTKLITTRVVFNEATNTNDTLPGFADTTDNKAFVNANSDIKFNDGFVFKRDLPGTVADSIFALEKNVVYGPYKDNEALKISKVIAQTQLPDSVKSRHILIPFVGSASATPETVQTEAQAKKTADSLLAIIKSDPKKFIDLLSFSADKTSNEKEGVLDWYTYNTMVPEFRDFTFENKTGYIGVLKTDFGFHIIEILDQKNYQKALKIATIARNIEPSETTIDNLFRAVSKFEIATQSKDFQDAAKDSSYVVRPVKSIQALQENIPGVGNQRQIVKWAFQDDVNIGDIKRFNIPQGYLVAQLTGKQEEGLMAIADARPIATPEILKQKKYNLIKDRVTATTLNDLGAIENQPIKSAVDLNMTAPIISGAGREPKVIGFAFGLEQGETSKLIQGENGAYMIEVTQKTSAPALDNYQGFANQVSQTKTNTVNTKLYDALKAAADIEDNRANTVE